MVFIGLVQGVGFRWWLTKTANLYNITGFCRNLNNGDVEAEIQSDNDSLDAFLKDILNIKGYIRIDDYSISKINIVEKEDSFNIKY